MQKLAIIVTDFFLVQLYKRYKPTAYTSVWLHRGEKLVNDFELDVAKALFKCKEPCLRQAAGPGRVARNKQWPRFCLFSFS